jgi:hypothetical protein
VGWLDVKATIVAVEPPAPASIDAPLRNTHANISAVVSLKRFPEAFVSALGLGEPIAAIRD